MKEKYIFYTLLVMAMVMLIGSKVGKKGEISTEELAIEKKLRKLAHSSKITLPEEIDMDRLQKIVAFSYYEGMLKRSPFSRRQRKVTEQAAKRMKTLPVEEATPRFIYKGKIAVENRLVVIIEQTRSGEVFMRAKGENVDGYKVLDITDTEVILSKKGEEDIILKTIERP